MDDLMAFRKVIVDKLGFWEKYLDSNPTNKERPLAWTRADTLRGILNDIDNFKRGQTPKR